ncbi:MAG: hypothetical protein QXG86_03525 [Candidatus Woesearchaeota archaeon]
MNKKCQVSTFLLLGVIIFIIVGVFLYERSQLVRVPEIKQPSDIGSLQLFVEQCLKKTGEEGIMHNSLQGGYYKNFEQTAIPITGYYKVPVYFDSDFSVKYIPSIQTIQKELEYYVQENMPSCIQNFSEVRGVNVTELGNVTIIDMILSEDKISILYDYPLLIDGATALNRFSVDYNFRLKKLYEVANELIEENKELPYLLCFSCHIKAAVNNNIRINTIDRGVYQAIVITDYTSKIPYSFAYAVKLRNLNYEHSLFEI